jgi:hypothetical protein
VTAPLEGPVVVRVVCDACGNRAVGVVKRRGDRTEYQFDAPRPESLKVQAEHRDLLRQSTGSGSVVYMPWRLLANLDDPELPAWTDAYCTRGHDLQPVETAVLRAAAKRGRPGRPAVVRIRATTPKDRLA